MNTHSNPIPAQIHIIKWVNGLNNFNIIITILNKKNRICLVNREFNNF